MIASVDARCYLGYKVLVDVPVEFHGVGIIGDPDVVPSFLNRCTDCYSSCVVPWDAKSAYSFDGVDDYIHVPFDPSLHRTEQISVWKMI